MKTVQIKRIQILIASVAFASFVSSVHALPNLELWLKASSLTNTYTDGQSVNAWTDLSGNGHNYNQGNSVQQPTFVANGVNGKTAVRFDGTNDFLATTPFTVPPQASGGLTYVAVMQTTRNVTTTNNDVNPPMTIFGFNANNVDREMGINGDRFQYTTYNYGPNYWQHEYASNSLNNGAWHILIATHDSSGALNLYVDGKLALATNSAYSTGNSGFLRELGVGYQNVNFFGGDLGELRAYDGALTAQEETLVANGLADSFGMTIPEPSAVALLGMAGLWFWRVRKVSRGFTTNVTKLTAVVALLGALFLPSRAPAVLVTNSAGSTLINDGFENNAVGSFPTGWIVTNRTGAAFNTADLDVENGTSPGLTPPVAREGTKFLADRSSNVGAYQTFAPLSSGTITMKLAFYLPNGGQGSIAPTFLKSAGVGVAKAEEYIDLDNWQWWPSLGTSTTLVSGQGALGYFNGSVYAALTKGGNPYIFSTDAWHEMMMTYNIAAGSSTTALTINIDGTTLDPLPTANALASGTVVGFQIYQNSGGVGFVDAIPEPSAVALLGMAGLFWRFRRVVRG